MCPRCGDKLWYGIGCLAHGHPPETPIAEPIQKKAPHRHWSQRAIEIAKREARRSDIHGKDISAIIERETGERRSYKAVKHFLARAGISKQRMAQVPRRRARPTDQNRHHKRYTEDEETALECGDLRLFGPTRTERGMYLKSWRLGLGVRQSGEWMSMADVVRTWEVTRKQVRWMIHKGDLPTRQLNKRVVLLDPGEVEDAMKRRRIGYRRKASRWAS